MAQRTSNVEDAVPISTTGPSRSKKGGIFYPEVKVTPKGATCWICLEGENKQDGQLSRNCACRGNSAGYVHIPCLVQYIKRKADEDYQTESYYVCSNCSEPFKSAFALELAKAYAETTKGMEDCDPRRVIARLTLAMRLIKSDPQKAKLVYLQLLKTVRSTTASDLCEYEVYCLVGLGAACEEMDDYCGAALYLSNAHEVALRCDYNPHHPVLLEIEWLQQRASGGNIGDFLPTSNSSASLLETRAAALRKVGSEHEAVILMDLALADTLFREGKVPAGKMTLKNAVTKSVLCLGQDHHTSIKAMLRHTEIYARIKRLPYGTIWKKNDDTWHGRRAVIAPPPGEACDEKYICASVDEEHQKMATTATVLEIVFDCGTPVICQGIRKAKDRALNGKRCVIKSYHSNKGQYIVKVSDDPHRHHSVKQDNVKVIFDDIR